MPDVPEIINELVAKFDQNRDYYLSSDYNEAQTRVEFINPFFEALGWDVTNKSGNSPAYMDVVFEGTMRVEGTANAPDYSFRVGQTRKFFVEAKKPNVRIEFDADPARQIRRYSWTAKLPLGLLTNFFCLSVYDCRFPPKPNDAAGFARIKHIKYSDYISMWDEIASVFSRDAVWKGSFDRYAEAEKGKRGTAEVDQEFLKQIEQWREVLARNIALRNPGLDVRELNFAVQSTIDRIVFLRICEDRGIEDAGRLLAQTNGENIYQRLVNLYHDADDKYNSGLFHFREERGRSSPDTFTPNLRIDDKALRDIIRGLYYPQSPYEFSVVGADILGSVYEQFLGKVIRLTPGGQAKVEEKPDVKKAGGVYYTPTYIVDYIVKNTVGSLCEGKTPKQVAKLRILDPACGSGSFLINAYAYLLDWHLNYYVQDGPEKHKKEIYRVSGGEWRLTTQVKKQILLNNIYGVDIDSQAVEVTKLSLLLKVLEGESAETLDASRKLFHERALPDLASNIKCGNSLVGTDFDTSGLSDEEIRRINPFDWESEFPEIMRKSGGFDAVIGNPPYVRQETISEYKKYLKETYETYGSAADLYVYFIERSLQLLRRNGLFSFIVSNKFVRSGYGLTLRQFIPARSSILQFIDFGDLPVFQNATVYPCIIVLQAEEDEGTRNSNQIWVCAVKALNFADLARYTEIHGYPLPQETSAEGTWYLQPLSIHPILAKIKGAGTELSLYCMCEPLFGVKTGLNEVFIVDENDIGRIVTDTAERGIFLPYLRGRNVRRYAYEHTGQYLLFTDGIDDKTHPQVMAYLRQHRTKLEKRTDIQNNSKKWYELRPCKYYDLIRKPKIMYASVARRGEFALDEEGIFVDKTCYFIPSTDRYLLGLLNSKLLFFYFSNIAVQRRGGYYEYLTEYVRQLPIRTIDFDDSADKARHDKMVELVNRMLDLHKELDAAKVPGEKTRIQRRIDSTDREIDALVYELYGLTEEEIRIVEENG